MKMNFIRAVLFSGAALAAGSAFASGAKMQPNTEAAWEDRCGSANQNALWNDAVMSEPRRVVIAVEGFGGFSQSHLSLVRNGVNPGLTPYEGVSYPFLLDNVILPEIVQDSELARDTTWLFFDEDQSGKAAECAIALGNMRYQVGDEIRRSSIVLLGFSNGAKSVIEMAGAMNEQSPAVTVDMNISIDPIPKIPEIIGIIFTLGLADGATIMRYPNETVHHNFYQRADDVLKGHPIKNPSAAAGDTNDEVTSALDGHGHLEICDHVAPQVGEYLRQVPTYQVVKR